MVAGDTPKPSSIRPKSVGSSTMPLTGLTNDECQIPEGIQVCSSNGKIRIRTRAVATYDPVNAATVVGNHAEHNNARLPSRKHSHSSSQMVPSSKVVSTPPSEKTWAKTGNDNNSRVSIGMIRLRNFSITMLPGDSFVSRRVPMVLLSFS